MPYSDLNASIGVLCMARHTGKTVATVLTTMKMAAIMPPEVRRSHDQMTAIRSGLSIGNGRTSTLSITLKTAVLAPHCHGQRADGGKRQCRASAQKTKAVTNIVEHQSAACEAPSTKPSRSLMMRLP